MDRFALRALAAIPAVLLVSTPVAGADLAAPTVFPNAFAAQQQRAAKAADGYASALFDSNSAEYMAAFRSALNSAAAITQPFPTVGVPRSAVPIAPTTTLFDRDPRYIANSKLLILNDQGAASERVWNGLPTTGYQNTVVITGNSGLCTGTAISKNVVITAQHCHCDGVNQFVGVGTHYDDQHPGIRVARSVPMKKCDKPVSAQADIALLILEQDFEASVIPATLASQSLIDHATQVRVVGFGRDEHNQVGQKLFVDVPVASTACGGSVKVAAGAQVPDSVYYGCNAGFELVASAPLLKKDTCNGDSGGPAFVRDQNGNDYLAAATSRAVSTPGANNCGDGGVYVRLDGAVAVWIKQQGVTPNVSP